MSTPEPEETRRITDNEWGEALHEYGYLRCGGCESEVDLSECDDIGEAKSTFADHLQNDCLADPNA